MSSLWRQTAPIAPRPPLQGDLETEAAVIGGVSLSGGVGTMYGAMIGVLIVGVIRNGMDILGINTYFQQILQAVIIFVAVYIDVRVNGKKK